MKHRILLMTIMLFTLSCSKRHAPTISRTTNGNPSTGTETNPEVTDNKTNIDSLIKIVVSESDWFKKYEAILGDPYAVTDVIITEEEKASIKPIKDTKHIWTDTVEVYKVIKNYCNNTSNTTYQSEIAKNFELLKTQTRVVTKAWGRSISGDAKFSGSLGPIKFGGAASASSSTNGTSTTTEITKYEEITKNKLTQNLNADPGKITVSSLELITKYTRQLYEGEVVINPNVIFLLKPDTKIQPGSGLALVQYKTGWFPRYLYNYYQTVELRDKLWELSPYFYSRWKPASGGNYRTTNTYNNIHIESPELTEVANYFKNTQTMYLGYIGAGYNALDSQFWIVPLNVILKEKWQRKFDIVLDELTTRYETNENNYSIDCKTKTP